jgi:hypothetical protein
LRQKTADHAALATILILITAAFAGILFRHHSLYIRDVTRFFAPNLAILRDTFRSGDFPFWTGRYNAGQPFAANPAYAVLYPPHWIAALTSLDLVVVGHYLLAAIGMYILLRSMRLRPPASLFGAISFALGGLLLSLSNLINVLFGVAWLPWLAFSARRFFSTRHSTDFALAALFLGAILLTADQAIILQAGFLLVAYSIRRRKLLLSAAIIAAALAVGSAQIIPALDHQRDSGRATPIPYAIATQWTLPPIRPLELALPALFGSFTDWTFYWAGKRFYPHAGVPWIFSFYSGLLVFVLACAGFVRRVRGWPFVACVVAVSYAVAVSPLLYLAGLHSIRYPEKFFIAAAFVLIVFASIAADQLLNDEALRVTATLVALVVIILAVASLYWTAPDRFAQIWRLSGYIGDLLHQARYGAVMTVATATALTLILGARRSLSPATWLSLLGLFVLADLAPRIRGLTPRIDRSYFDPPEVALALRGARVYNDAEWRLALLPTPPIPIEQRAWRVRNSMLPEAQAMWGVDAVLENDITLTNLIPSIEFSRTFWSAQLAHRSDIVPRLLAMAGTTHVIELRDATSANRPIRLVALPANRRFYFADQIANGSLLQLFDRSFSPRVALTDLKPFTPAPGRVIGASEHQNAIDIDVEASGDALLVMAVTRHKYWKGILDGMPAALHPANVAFQSMVVPRGRHHVALRYGNPLIMIFGVVSIVSAAVLMAIAVAGALRSRAPQPPSPR